MSACHFGQTLIALLNQQFSFAGWLISFARRAIRVASLFGLMSTSRSSCRETVAGSSTAELFQLVGQRSNNST
jgi:hypothetical protein